MRILLLGQGAALHILAWKMVSETAVVEIHCAPGNAGTMLLLGPAPFAHLHATEIAQWAFAQQVDLVIVQGRPEWVETLTSVALPVLGVGKKEWQALRRNHQIREELRAHAVPLPPGQAFRTREHAERYIASRPLPLWLRPNDAAEREIIHVADRLEAFQQLARLLGLYPQDGIYIEEAVDGPEVALGLLSDGEHTISLGVSHPYDRRHEGETGPLTEGMGAYAPYGDKSLEERLLQAVGQPVTKALQAAGVLRPSFLHLRIVLGPAGPVLRDLAWDLDDLHAAVTLPRWAGDAAGTLYTAAGGRMEEATVSWKPGIAVAAAVVVENYPRPGPSGQPLPSIYDTPAMVWHHATKLTAEREKASILPAWLRSLTPSPGLGVPSQVLTAGGRVLFVTGYADSAYEACQQVYQGAAQLAFEHSDWRQDIASELL